MLDDLKQCNRDEQAHNERQQLAWVYFKSHTVFFNYDNRYQFLPSELKNKQRLTWPRKSFLGNHLPAKSKKKFYNPGPKTNPTTQGGSYESGDIVSLNRSLPAHISFNYIEWCYFDCINHINMSLPDLHVYYFTGLIKEYSLSCLCLERLHQIKVGLVLGPGL